jgi:hypothetical protein
MYHLIKMILCLRAIISQLGKIGPRVIGLRIGSGIKIGLILNYQMELLELLFL